MTSNRKSNPKVKKSSDSKATNGSLQLSVQPMQSVRNSLSSSSSMTTKVAMTREEIDEKKKRWLEERAKEQLRKRIEGNVKDQLLPVHHHESGQAGTTQLNSSFIGLLTDTVEKSLKEELKLTKSFSNTNTPNESGNLDEQEEDFLDTEMENHKCGVCFELMLDGDRTPMIIVPCGHCFCKNCLSLLSNRKCPTCRAPFTSQAVNFALKQVITSYYEMKQQKEKKRKQESSILNNSNNSVNSSHASIDPSLATTFQSILRKTTSENRSEVEKYLSQFVKAKTRLNILSESLGETTREIDGLKKHEKIAESHLNQFNEDHSALVTEIEEKMKQLEELKRAIEEQERVSNEIGQHRLQVEQKKQFLLQSIQSIEREREKSKLIICNYVPNLSDNDFY